MQCNGNFASQGNCPRRQGLSCKLHACPAVVIAAGRRPVVQRCWGTIECAGDKCPPGYKEGQFCRRDGASANFKVRQLKFLDLHAAHGQ